jgi:DNA-binding NarL/FixJ family response regulator
MNSGPARATDQDNRKTRILIIDDHPIVRHSFKQLIDGTERMTVCGEASDPAGAIRLVAQTSPDVVVVDLSLGAHSGFQLIEDLQKRWKELPILVLSMHEEAGYAERALRLGARGYVMKKEATEKILTALELVTRGELYVADEIKNKLVVRLIGTEAGGRPAPIDVLSNRELEVLQMLGQGLKPRLIAERLSLSIKTVETYCEHLKNKLHLGNAHELTAYAAQWVGNTSV